MKLYGKYPNPKYKFTKDNRVDDRDFEGLKNVVIV